MHRVLFSALLLLAACSSKKDSSTSTTTPPGDSAQATTPPVEGSVDDGATVAEETAPVDETGTAAEPALPDDGGKTGSETKPVAPGGPNLKVLPANISKADLKATMKQISVSLGVQCDFCHDTDDMASDADPHKLAAREMMLMTMDLNKKFFGGEMEITCNTCHKGKEEPAN